MPDLSHLPLRKRMALFFVAIFAGGALAIGIGLWLGYARAGDAAEGYVIAGLVAVLGLGALCTWVAMLFDENVAQPLTHLASELETRANAPVDHRLDAAQAKHLGALAPAAAAITRSLRAAREERAQVVEERTRRIAREKALFEAILRDLAEGVIACTPEGRVTLYNRVATALVPGLGLDRDLAESLDTAPIPDALQRLSLQSEESPETLRLTPRAGAPLTARVMQVRDTSQLTEDPRGPVIGHVLALRPEDGGSAPLAPTDPRPEFYDFDLFDPIDDHNQLTRSLRKLPFVVFDTETTGLSPRGGDQIVQIAARRIVAGRLLDAERFETFVDPGRKIPPASTRVHGITDADVAGAPDIGAAGRAFHDFVGDAVMVAHNAPFDLAFLRLASAQTGRDFDRPVLCTVLLSAALFDHTGKHTLDDLAARFGVEIPPALRHTAMGDTTATAEVFLHLIDLMEARGVTTLGGALQLSKGMTQIRRAQADY